MRFIKENKFVLSIIALGIVSFIFGIVFFGSYDEYSESVRYIDTDQVYEGYTLYSPLNDSETLLVNNSGELVHEWNSTDYFPGNSEYLLEDGTLVRGGKLEEPPITYGGASGVIEAFSWDDELLWDYKYVSDEEGSEYIYHHDFEILPNGNIIMLVWQNYTNDQALAHGLSQEYIDTLDEGHDGIVVERIIEVDIDTEEIVWEWNSWDHMIQEIDPELPNYGVVSENPQLIDINYVKFAGTEGDIHHGNSIDYNAELDQILLSIRHFNEIWIIDHSTTTEEARGDSGGQYGKGGNLIYRWGNPEAFKQGGEDDRDLFKQHDAEWIGEGLDGEGNILIFSNGEDETREYSTVVEIIPPLRKDGSYEMTNHNSYVEAPVVWEYGEEDGQKFYSFFISGAQRLPNGNTLITNGANGVLIEVTDDKEVVWDFRNPRLDVSPRNGREGRQVFRADKYSVDYPAFTNRDFGNARILEVER